MEIMDEYKLEVFKDYFDSGEIRKFRELMMYYECAMLEVKTKLDVLNKELALKKSRNPFESIKCRIKTPESIVEKLARRGIEFSVDNIEKELNDIAGIRVICSFPDDIYELIDYLLEQDDIRLIAIKDYIKNPKPNGYRSVHLIIEVPIFLTDMKKPMRVEVQFRTIAMDFWASLEHKLQYKKNIPESQSKFLKDELYDCAQQSAALDKRMQNIRNVIAASETAEEENAGFPANLFAGKQRVIT